MKFIRVAHLHWNQDTFSHRKPKRKTDFDHLSIVSSALQIYCSQKQSHPTLKKRVFWEEPAHRKCFLKKQMHTKLLKNDTPNRFQRFWRIWNSSELFTQSCCLSGSFSHHRREKKKQHTAHIRKMFTCSFDWCNNILWFMQITTCSHYARLREVIFFHFEFLVFLSPACLFIRP